MRIIVLAGGLSPERDVSLSSGAGICKTLRKMATRLSCLTFILDFPTIRKSLRRFLTFRAPVLRLPRASRPPCRTWKL